MGDGTFGFHCAEIDTAVRYRLPFVAVVGNDARWNAEYQIQLRDYGAGPPRRLRAAADALRPGGAAFGGHGEHVTQAGRAAGGVRAWRCGPARVPERDDRGPPGPDHQALTCAVRPGASQREL